MNTLHYMPGHDQKVILIYLLGDIENLINNKGRKDIYSKLNIASMNG